MPTRPEALRAVIFDLGGVVVDSPLHVIAGYERDLGIPAGFVNRVVVETGPQGAWSRMERGEIAMREFENAFEKECLRAGHAIRVSALMARIAGCRPRLVMLRAIARLREAGLRVGALTNNWAPVAERENPHELHDLFHAVIESSKVGLRKPDPRIYQLACRSLDVEPGETAFLDDIGRNLKTARQLGMWTLKVDRPEPALEALSAATGVALL